MRHGKVILSNGCPMATAIASAQEDLWGSSTGFGQSAIDDEENPYKNVTCKGSFFILNIKVNN